MELPMVSKKIAIEIFSQNLGVKLSGFKGKWTLWDYGAQNGAQGIETVLRPSAQETRYSLMMMFETFDEKEITKMSEMLPTAKLKDNQLVFDDPETAALLVLMEIQES
jgi:hypothetical protein